MLNLKSNLIQKEKFISGPFIVIKLPNDLKEMLDYFEKSLDMSIEIAESLTISTHFGLDAYQLIKNGKSTGYKKATKEDLKHALLEFYYHGNLKNFEELLENAPDHKEANISDFIHNFMAEEDLKNLAYLVMSQDLKSLLVENKYFFSKKG